MTWKSIGAEARNTPVIPPMTNTTRNPTTISIAVVSQIEPRHMVASQLNTLMPVGTAMMNDMIENQYRLIWPVVNMWWAQTVKE